MPELDIDTLPTGDKDRRNQPVNVLSRHKTFRYEYTQDVPECYSECNEVHRTGTFVRVFDAYTILAPSREIADAAFADHTKYSKAVKIVSVLAGQIDYALIANHG